MTFDAIIVGYFAGFCTAVAQFPQAYKVICKMSMIAIVKTIDNGRYVNSF